MLWISVFLLSQDGLLKILTTALCLTDNKSDTARRFISHEDSGQRVLWAQHLERVGKL